MSTDLEGLGKAKYIALTTYRKDGTAVSTPVWLVREGDALLVTTQGSSGKAKRIRNNPNVTVAPCNSRGTTKGPALPAIATLAESAEAERITALVAKKYGLLGRFLTRRGDASDRVGIILTPA
jgi:PPOX class probable F420-dependent enzyme